MTLFSNRNPSYSAVSGVLAFPLLAFCGFSHIIAILVLPLRLRGICFAKQAHHDLHGMPFVLLDAPLTPMILTSLDVRSHIWPSVCAVIAEPGVEAGLHGQSALGGRVLEDMGIWRCWKEVW